ncbi:helix-turn-helix transcriptional regulator [Geosporobacter ferrireducens]|uniref:Transcriptional regulator n=1 Tax=Geosporobacter ferrireducens TaxID=1424294 RepID=A0A1D8GIW7_9FIRM|nr:transcriptional regulator [Geosporobacter ferrireducens]AOT70854.1 transcriptional regulator [Geosporobacter ferrireducens]
MSSIGNALKLYLLLQSKGKMKIRDIAKELEVDERTVRRYRDDLEQAMIYIDSQAGKHGGYYLHNDNYLLGLNLTCEEYLTFLMIKEELEKSNHVVLKDYDSALQKIQQVYISGKNEKDRINIFNFIAKGTKANININEERKKLIDIHAAALTKNKIQIQYTSLSSGLTERIVRPYATIQYKGDMYFTGYCERKQAIADFKLCRIHEYTVLNEKFLADKSFDLDEYMKNCIGIFKDDEIHIKLKVYHPMSQIVKEKIWVENQIITENEEDHSIIYEATMKGVEEIKSWILSMGSKVKVISPQFLADKIKNEIKNMHKIY